MVISNVCKTKKRNKELLSYNLSGSDNHTSENGIWTEFGIILYIILNRYEVKIPGFRVPVDAETHENTVLAPIRYAF